MKGGTIMSKSDQNENNKKAEMREDNKTDYSKAKENRLLARAREVSTVRKIVVIVLLCIIILLLAGGISGYFYIKNGLEPADTSDETQKTVTVPMGSSTTQIAGILEDEGIIANQLIYRFYVKFNNAAGFQAGDYQLSPAMTLAEITNKLQTGVVMQEPLFSVTIPEGKSIDQIAELFAKHANFSKEEFLERMQDTEYIESLIDAHSSLLSDEVLQDDIRYPLEGYLYAATYQFYEENPSIDTVVNKMLKKSEQVVLKYYPKMKEMEDYTLHDLLTLASLVEKEARTEEDRKRIAGVFYNRLDQDMPLQTDPTVLYALGTHKDTELKKGLDVDSPYNTYQVKGLTPGPISNFGESSLQAVIEPEDTKYLYFLAAPDGEVYFSETLDQHNEKINKYLNREE